MSVVRFLIDNSVHVLGFLLQHRKTMPDVVRADGRVCVNLGCGLALAPRWINVDGSLNALFGGAPRFFLRWMYRLSGANRYYSEDVYCRLLQENRFVFHDLARSLPFPPGSVDVFFSSHFFEHLFKKDASRLLKEMRGALKEGGLVRIAVPDLAHSVQLYHQGHKRKMLDDYFFVDDLHSYMARHKYMYDEELLTAMLKEAGYRDIRRCAYREGRAPDLDQLDNRPEETLFMEAVR